ncbi:DUF3828 domain-containing protein [Enterovirga rhinocerotis]|uniref:Uncharacterized protein DUF3828 n=1 Tax=Enterovirga rhinocerotis TaxID=1339210 RepID=A0A4R7C6V3_9HYPH|nr:DUF3828 domain-containing protein [Enterovirga rhinocerotis]TDR93682.1 uncharacterized protein DUF3828 [Enterovirga rhinocerotis]
MLRVSIPLVAGLLVLAGGALADDLGGRVRDLYRPYEKEGADAPDATKTVRPITSKRLRTLLDRDEACTRRTNSICNLGFDFIVNGQDYKIEKVEVSPVDTQGDRANVTARFLNMGGRHETRYEFIREGEAWRLDDIVALQPKDFRWRLTTLLSPKKGGRAR